MASQVTDYASLVAAVPDYLDRTGDTDFTGRLDTFIGLFEDTLTPTILNRQMEKTASLTTASDGSVALPSDFYRLRALYATINGVQTNLPMVGPVAEQGIYPIITGDTPNFARIMGSTLYVVPEQVLTCTMDYWGVFTGLSGSNTTNWIINDHPSLYFFGTMAQACLWLHDWSAAQNWEAMAQAQLDQIMDKFALDYFSNTDLVLDTFTP